MALASLIKNRHKPGVFPQQFHPHRAFYVFSLPVTAQKIALA
jgi:hypothetical protein